MIQSDDTKIVQLYWDRDEQAIPATSEKLRGEIYSITGISNDVAVALKFLDKGEAVTTTHYYVILNPGADLTPVAEYIIAISTSNNFSDEMAGIIPE